MIQQSTVVENKEIRSERYTSMYLNKEKLRLLKRAIKNVKKLKNQYSKFCFEHLYDLFIMRSYIDFSKLYWKQISKQYPAKYIKQWNAQSIFQDVVIQYITRIKTYLSNLDLSVSEVDESGNTKFKISYYKKNVSKNGEIIHYKGDIKEFKQPKKYTSLSKFVKYCVHCRVENGHVCLPDNQEIKDLYEYYCGKFTEERIVRLVSSIQDTLLKKIKKPNEYQTGSFRIAYKHGGNNQTWTDSDFIYGLFSATYCKNEEFDIKYSRLVRLLRLNNVKSWFMSQAEKRGIRVHLTPAAYSSQQCPHCGHISRDNRPTQEEFKCVECGHSSNADYNSSKNLKFRYTNVLLRSKLHKLDKYDRMMPKIMKKEKIKEILISAYPKVDSC